MTDKKALPSFRELQDRLETILVKLQADDIDVDEALMLHQQGSQLVEQLEQRLKAAEHTVSQLKAKRG